MNQPPPENPIQVMLDLKTWGTRAGAVITAIGAVKFVDRKLKDEFYQRIDLRSSLDKGMHLDGDTVIAALSKK